MGTNDQTDPEKMLGELLDALRYPSPEQTAHAQRLEEAAWKANQAAERLEEAARRAERAAQEMNTAAWTAERAARM